MLTSDEIREILKDVATRVRYNWRVLFFIVVPFLLAPIAIVIPIDPEDTSPDPNRKFRCAYVISFMAACWVTEVIPLAVTALFPIVFFPLFAVDEASEISRDYMKESNMIFIGAIVLALAIEYCGLHIRVALRIVSIFGSNPVKVLFGTMVITALMAMWVSDASCTTMLLPILSALSNAMFREEQEEIFLYQPPERHSSLDTSSEGHNPRAQLSKHPSQVSLATNVRRDSHVFANPAMQGHLAGLRRRSRRSIDRQHVSPVHSRTSIQRFPSSSSSDPHDHPHHNSQVEGGDSMGVIMEGVPVMDEETVNQNLEAAENEENVRKMLLFSVAYSANIGGTGSLVGTGPVKVFKELLKRYYYHRYGDGISHEQIPVTFGSWMLFNIPTLLVNIFFAWLFLVFRYIGWRRFFRSDEIYRKDRKSVKQYLDEEYKKLGPITAHEISVIVVFFIVVLLWLFRDPNLFPGWGSLREPFDTRKCGDSTAAMIGVLLFFILPKHWDFLKCRKYQVEPGFKYEALLNWKFVSTNAPWGYVILIGSGFAIADASEKSGLTAYIGAWLTYLYNGNISLDALLVLVMTFTSIITEILSNTACANLFLPVLFDFSCKNRIHPAYLTMATAVSASYGFMLPISSPPNAIIFATGEIGIREMFFNGIFLNLICVPVLYCGYLIYGDPIFQFSSYNGSSLSTHNCSLAHFVD